MLAAAAAAHSAAGSAQRFDGPLAEAISAGRSVVAVVEVAGTPRAVTGPGGAAERWSVPVVTQEVSTGGVRIRTHTPLVVMGGRDWGPVVPGQTVRAAGTLRPAEPGRTEAGNLVASTSPARSTAGPVLQETARELRGRFVAAASFLEPDARGLLPGMVTGDTSALDQGLGNAMKVVGMTHLTAVSGANYESPHGLTTKCCEVGNLRLENRDAPSPQSKPCRQDPPDSGSAIAAACQAHAMLLVARDIGCLGRPVDDR
ncbi:hypothetical protein ACFVVC_01120 [Pseudarthrobacter sp. NPDC058196]|uniref:hypothetical protein n=1 Tax=Pseudarthrobacter sp. NPDC058196 TaxID=3346376 RepID=UPI0036DB7635